MRRFFKEFIKMIYMDLRWSGINSMTLLDNAKYMVEEQVKSIQKKIQQTESAFDVATEDLFNQTIKLEEMEKKAGNAESQAR